MLRIKTLHEIEEEYTKNFFDMFLNEANNTDTINETIGSNGVDYEISVLNSIKKGIIGLPNISLATSKQTAAYSSHDTDIDIFVNGEKIAFEVKLNWRAQMGGPTLTYNMKAKQFYFNEKQSLKNTKLINKIVATCQLKINEFKKLVKFLRKENSQNVTNDFYGISMITTKQAWQKAVSKDLLKDLNLSVEDNTAYIHDHYANKNCYYMQIGGSGLFYLKDNPLQLPIPQLKGKINIEIRPSKSGSKYVKKYGEKTSSISIRLEGRLISQPSSPYTLDNSLHVQQLFSQL